MSRKHIGFWLASLFFVALLLHPTVEGAELAKASQEESAAIAQLPLPLESVRPDDGGFFFQFGSSVGGGWRFSDGALIDLQFRKSRPTLVYRHPLYETADLRCSVLLGNRVGAALEYYLGHGFSAEVQVGFPVSAPFFRVSWYPFEFLSFCFDSDFGFTVLLSL